MLVGVKNRRAFSLFGEQLSITAYVLSGSGRGRFRVKFRGYTTLGGPNVRVSQMTGAISVRILGCILVLASGLFAQQLQFNALYNCPDSSLYDFKVLGCTKDDCEVFFKNSSPEGGFKGEVSKARIAAALRTGKCTMNGTVVIRETTSGAMPPAPTGRAIDLGGDKAIVEGAACVARVPPAAAAGPRPSPALIKRVIYERYRDMESGRPVGITFKSLALSSSFVNRLVSGGLLHQSAPIGATIYRYKTDFVTCVKYTDSILRMEVKEGYFRCFRDKTGAWACADDGRKSWDQTHLPVT